MDRVVLAPPCSPWMPVNTQAIGSTLELHGPLSAPTSVVCPCSVRGGGPEAAEGAPMPTVKAPWFADRSFRLEENVRGDNRLRCHAKLSPAGSSAPPWPGNCCTET